MGMKRKLFLTILGLSGSGILALAATADSCTDKYNACMSGCANAFSQCKGHGLDPSKCEQNQAACKSQCEKEKAKCQGNKTEPQKPTPKPKKSDSKKQ